MWVIYAQPIDTPGMSLKQSQATTSVFPAGPWLPVPTTNHPQAPSLWILQSLTVSSQARSRPLFLQACVCPSSLEPIPSYPGMGCALSLPLPLYGTFLPAYKPVPIILGALPQFLV